MTSIPRTKTNEAKFTAFIDHYLSFPSYLGSYKRTFDILIKEVLATNSHVDHVAYPMLFVARHCMELGFKTNIRYFAKYSGKDDYTTAGTHDLDNLFKAFKMHVKGTYINLKTKFGIVVEKEDKDSFEELCIEVDQLNDTFHALDKNSDAFRYPVDKNRIPLSRTGKGSM